MICNLIIIFYDNRGKDNLEWFYDHYIYIYEGVFFVKKKKVFF